MTMLRHLRHLLLTSAVAALLPGAAAAESLADALVKAYQTSPLL